MKGDYLSTGSAMQNSLRDCELRVGMHAEHTLSDTALITIVCRLGLCYLTRTSIGRMSSCLRTYIKQQVCPSKCTWYGCCITLHIVLSEPSG